MMAPDRRPRPRREPDDVYAAPRRRGSPKAVRAGILSLALWVAVAAPVRGGGTGGAPLWDEQRGDWIPAAVGCLLTVHGADRAAETPGAKSEDKWLTVEILFSAPAPAEFGVHGADGFLSLADSGAVAVTTGTPPGARLCWGFAPAAKTGPAGDGFPPEAGAGPVAVLLDRASLVPARCSIRPPVPRDYYARALLYFDLDADGLADRVVMLTADPRSGFLPSGDKID